MAKIIIIDDEPAMVEVIVTLCRDKGHQVFPFNSATKAVEQLDAIQPQVVITDIKMETMSGFDVLRHVREHHRQTSVILITAYASVETAIEAMKLGAYDYITKPFKVDELQLTIQRALDHQAAGPREPQSAAGAEEQVPVREHHRHEPQDAGGLQSDRQGRRHGHHDPDLRARAERARNWWRARCISTATGSISPLSRSTARALPENLLESELFGHKKGAFTGAVRTRSGSSRKPKLGTIFLDEVNSMAQPLQTKLLRVLQERADPPRGRQRRACRSMCACSRATNEALQTKIKDGTFPRGSLLPARRHPDRDAGTARAARRYSAAGESLSCRSNASADRRPNRRRSIRKRVDILCALRWPGNVRELENAIERACALCDDDRSARPIFRRRSSGMRKADQSEQARRTCRSARRSMNTFANRSARYIEETIKFNAGSREKAAKMLGISMATLYRKVEAKNKVDTRRRSAQRL